MINLHSRPVVELIPELLRHFNEVHSVTFVLYKPAPVFSERLRQLFKPQNDLHRLADQLNREYGIPFWEALLSIEMKAGQLPREYVQLAILHDSHPDEYSIELPLAEITSQKLTSVIEDAGSEYGVAISSRVRLEDGELAHIPMLDFRCDCSDRNREVVKWAATAIGQRSGAIVNSGRSFHFYGFRLLTAPEWVRFVSLAALFSPVVDARYVAHRLIDGACRLRITKAPGRASVPVVAEVFHDEL
jgi:hypothetical protein